MSSLRLQHRRDGQKKRSKVVSLNLVSLMDIFTILVFFLMVNSSDESLQSNDKIKLPDSTAEKTPKNQLLISVNQDDLIVMGRPVAKVADLTGDELMIEGLQEELRYQASRKGDVPEGGYEVSIMGDKTIPYWLLKKIMYTCQATDFARIALAVNKVEADGEADADADAGAAAAAAGATGAAS